MMVHKESLVWLSCRSDDVDGYPFLCRLLLVVVVVAVVALARKGMSSIWQCQWIRLQQVCLPKTLV